MAHHFSSGKPVTHCSSVRVESHSMFDVSNLPFRDQFEAAVVVSGVCLAAAVVLREWFTDREIRIIARILGAAGWAVVVTFAWRMTVTNETLATQLIVQGKPNASPVSDSLSFVVPEKVVEVATKAGTRVSWTECGEGRIGAVSVTGGRSGRGRLPIGLSGGIVAGAVDGTDDVPNAKHVEKF